MLKNGMIRYNWKRTYLADHCKYNMDFIDEIQFIYQDVALQARFLK